MSVIGSFDKQSHLGELATPIVGGATGTLTPAQRRAATLANLYGTDGVDMTAGSGFTGTGSVYAASVEKVGGVFHTKIVIDLTGLNSGGAENDIIGGNAAANCHLGQVTAARNGTIQAIQMTCLEAPATGETDIDLYSAVEATGTEDALVTDLTETALISSGAAWTNGRVLGSTAVPAANEYLYLAGGDATPASATYTAGKFLIELFGT